MLIESGGIIFVLMLWECNDRKLQWVKCSLVFHNLKNSHFIFKLDEKLLKNIFRHHTQNKLGDIKSYILQIFICTYVCASHINCMLFHDILSYFAVNLPFLHRDLNYTPISQETTHMPADKDKTKAGPCLYFT